MFTEDGTITEDALSGNLVRNIIPGPRLQADADLWAQLAAQDPDPDNWAKGTTVDFPDAPYPFGVHFVWHLPTNSVRFDLDFKIRFNQVFEP
jgi:hypothetical protein